MLQSCQRFVAPKFWGEFHLFLQTINQNHAWLMANILEMCKKPVKLFFGGCHSGEKNAELSWHGEGMSNARPGRLEMSRGRAEASLMT